MNNSFILKDAYKKFTQDQDKIIPPEATLENVKNRFARLDLSILEKTVRIDNGRLDIPVYFSVCGEDAARLTGTTKQMGKGATPAQAETSAVMELVERFSFYNFASTPQHFIYDTHSNLKDQTISLFSGKVDGSYAMTPMVGMPMPSVKSDIYRRMPFLLYLESITTTAGSVADSNRIPGMVFFSRQTMADTWRSTISQMP